MQGLSLILWICLSLILAGCNNTPADQPETAIVIGTVTFDGKPLDQATVTFQPESGRMSTGVTDAAGHYELNYNESTQGAKLGPHTVSITTFRQISDLKNLSSPPFAEILPPKCHAQTELKADVKPGKNEIPFELSSK